MQNDRRRPLRGATPETSPGRRDWQTSTTQRAEESWAMRSGLSLLFGLRWRVWCEHFVRERPYALGVEADRRLAKVRPRRVWTWRWAQCRRVAASCRGRSAPFSRT